jgi:hypothetical protein
MIRVQKTYSGVRDIPLLSLLRDALEPLRQLTSETYILSRTSKALTASQYTKRWAAFWRRYGMAHPVV